MKLIFPFFCALIIAVFVSCSEESGPLFISIDQEKQLGAQFDSTILATPSEYPVLSETDYPEAHRYLRGMVDEILQSGQVKYADEFEWTTRIIENDSVLNAFATPGGYIYVYTGLIKYLEQEDDLAGVLGHEVAHADLRHSARNIERVQGLQFLLGLLVGNSGELTQTVAGLAGNVAGLSFSRAFETEADAESVEYLSATQYNCAGAASFFEKLQAAGQTGGPAFLSTHPNPGNRVENITEKAQEIGCSTTPANPASYEDFKASLP